MTFAKFSLLFLVSVSVLGPPLSAKAQSTTSGEEKFLVLPLFGYSDEQGLGVGVNAVWLNVDGTPWEASSALFASSLYQQSFVNLNFTNRHLLDQLYFQFGGFLNRSSRSLFYGLGNDTSLSNVSQYSTSDSYIYAKGGVHLSEEVVAGLTYSHRSTGIDLGADPALPQFLNMYPKIPRISGTTTTAVGFFGYYDTRGPGLAANSGEFYYLALEKEQPREGEDLSLLRLTLAGEQFYDLSDKDLVLALREKYERSWGEDVPFFLEETLGGPSSLRGYRTNRFIDASEFLLNIEPRWDIWDVNGSLIQRIELSLGLDLGRVFDAATIPPFSGYRSNWDLGITGILPSNVPVRVDYAFGPEGTLFYIHLFYPF